MESHVRGRPLARRHSFSCMAARDCIEQVAHLKHRSAVRLARSASTLDEVIRCGSLVNSDTGAGWWWTIAPPPPTQPPHFDSTQLSAIVDEIWGQALGAGLSPFDTLSFSLMPHQDIIGRIRFDIVTPEPIVIRPWVDVSIVHVERAYYELIGASPSEVFTATSSAAVGILRPVGIHIPSHLGFPEIVSAISRYIDTSFEVIFDIEGFSSIEHWLRRKRFAGVRHAEWRLPLGLAMDGRMQEAEESVSMLVDGLVRHSHSRTAHEYQWLGRRLRARY